MDVVEKILKESKKEEKIGEKMAVTLEKFFEEEEDIERSLSIISERFSFAPNFEQKAQLSELSDKEIFAFSILLAIADRIQELNPNKTNVLKSVVENIITLRISKRRKSRKEILELVKGLSKSIEEKQKRIKDLFV